MAWQHDRDVAREYGAALGIPFHEIIEAKRDTGWTWNQVADRLYDQLGAAEDWLAGYNVDDLYDEDLPDVFNYYHSD